MALWIVDHQPARRLGLAEDPLPIVIREAGHSVIETEYSYAQEIIPIALVPVLNSGRSMILRGSVGFTAWAHALAPIHPGAFPSPLLASASYLPEYGELALNAQAIVVTHAEFEAQRIKYENRLGGTLFIKPADGGKFLSGTVLEPGRSLFDAHYSQHRRWMPVPDDFRLLIARAQPIKAEWRFVIAGERVVTGSQYKRDAQLDIEAGAPSGAEAAASTIAQHPWRPADVFVADIAQTDDRYHLLELNTFGTAGMYACDLAAVV